MGDRGVWTSRLPHPVLPVHAPFHSGSRLCVLFLLRNIVPKLRNFPLSPGSRPFSISRLPPPLLPPPVDLPLPLLPGSRPPCPRPPPPPYEYGSKVRPPFNGNLSHQTYAWRNTLPGRFFPFAYIKVALRDPRIWKGTLDVFYSRTACHSALATT